MRHWTFFVPALLLGGLLLTAPVQAAEKAALDGAALVKDRCTTCHGAGRIDKAKKDRKGWEENVDRMITKGAKLDKAERDAVVAYLSGR
jgi:mono/diheme cytochrome c family protein